MIELHLKPSHILLGYDCPLLLELVNTSQGACTQVIFDIDFPSPLSLIKGKSQVEEKRLVSGEKREYPMLIMALERGEFPIVLSGLSYRSPDGKIVYEEQKSLMVQVIEQARVEQGDPDTTTDVADPEIEKYSSKTENTGEKTTLSNKTHDKQEKPIKILFLAANPSDTTRLKLGVEHREIDQALYGAEYRLHFEFIALTATRVKDLETYLLRHRPKIVHFSGHGSSENEIIFEDDLGRYQPVSAYALRSLFTAFSEDIRCVVLNACFSMIQAQAIAEHIDCVIGMSQAISDDAAICFSTAFYQAIGYGKDLQTAFNLGCVQIDLLHSGEQETPQLIAQRIDPRRIFFI